MLKFYSLYKQATEGKCTQPKPAFWAVVNKAKWDAWKALGNMPKEEAMRQYVEELKQVSSFRQLMILPAIFDMAPALPRAISLLV